MDPRTPNPRALRVDDKTGSRKTPRIDILCLQCGARILVWCTLPARSQARILFPCPHCDTNNSVHIQQETFDKARAPAYFAQILRGRGRADRRYKLTTHREDRPRMTDHRKGGTPCP
jgi:hypothetical protein